MTELLIRPLNSAEVESDDFRHLLWLAAELEDRELDRIKMNELPQLILFGGIYRSQLSAFVAFDTDTDPVTIEYIAVDENAQGHGFGTALVREVQQHSLHRTLYAETDDDAVEFYRRLGFTVRAGEADPRWPTRQRYECWLPA